ncbi:Na+-dependent transporter [Telmatocola sphagniphila]|uniref:Na+-dependent transporter n=1 Tax=Telmatocola sphagniphila TaxID=1123043 RepID=A0A8E6B3U8_9BACT|nr:bile acid:sodium symporter [Telmatocola sphagniphila]QVL31453.1 Na+-dependent transporter [Telmatocola sphagniphila]
MIPLSLRKFKLAEFVHHHFLHLLILSYVLAAFFPALGSWIRTQKLGHAWLGEQHIPLSLTSTLLALLLFNAGLGLRVDQIARLVYAPHVLVLGLLANLFVPLLFLTLISLSMSDWHNPSEVQCILLGLALVASMPIAGSSAAWTQSADGDLALGLGLILGSTLLSPITTPISLYFTRPMAEGEYLDLLNSFCGSETMLFMLTFVLLPTLLGISVRMLAGAARLANVLPRLKLLNTAILLTLCYSNAAISLPQTIAEPDWDFLLITLLFVCGMCGIGFGTGYGLSRLLKSPREQRLALMYGLGMSNNGTALVIASMTVSSHPRVLLPVIFYNLVQHLFAGWVLQANEAPEESAGK